MVIAARAAATSDDRTPGDRTVRMAEWLDSMMPRAAVMWHSVMPTTALPATARCEWRDSMQPRAAMMWQSAEPRPPWTVAKMPQHWTIAAF